MYSSARFARLPDTPKRVIAMNDRPDLTGVTDPANNPILYFSFDNRDGVFSSQSTTEMISTKLKEDVPSVACEERGNTVEISLKEVLGGKTYEEAAA